MHSFDTTFENFTDQVLEASKQVPILVDFWAPWCGPCQSLMPVLMSLADQYNGSFRLAKVNIDEQQQLAQQFAVRSVPTVKLFKNGQAVDGFTGALPESAIRSLLDKYIEKESDKLMSAALEKYNAGDRQAVQDMIAIINNDPSNNNIRLLYVDVLLQEKQYDDAQAILQAMPEDIRKQPEVAGLMSRLEFMGTAGKDNDLDQLIEAVSKDPNDCDARYKLSAIYISQGNYESAMEEFLEIMRRDRQYNDDAGRKGMLKVFDMLGGSGELVSRYRQKMASLLY